MKSIFITILTFAVLASCTSNDMEEDALEQQVASISVMAQPRKIADGIDVGSKADEAPIIIDSFEKGSTLYISQVGTTADPNFTDNFNNSNLYIYQYKKNESATWDEEYNFEYDKSRKPIDWQDVKALGPVGNAFSLYALYFPVDNRVKFKVEPDQTGGANDPYDTRNFKKSDIMGAYHATSSLYTRLRFRLFHLMVYLKVTLYVPIHKDNGKEASDKDYKYSGFAPNALQGAFVMNAYRDFSIEWRANRSSDTPPYPQDQKSGTKENIRMYQHPFHNDETSKIDIDIRDYYSENNNEVNEYQDEVYKYTFSVLFPSQQFGGNFLCFVLKAIDGQLKYYYFSSNQIKGDSDSNGLVSGTLQELELYLPRTTNQTILIGAKVLPWEDAVTDMTVTKDSSKEGGENPDSTLP